MTFSAFTAGLMGVLAGLADLATGRFFDVVALVAFWLAVPLFVLAAGAATAFFVAVVMGRPGDETAHGWRRA
jgi:hypothetical protein